MPQSVSLDDLANAMRNEQENPGSGNSSQMVWDAERGMFVKLNSNERPTSTQTPMNVLSKEPYFC